MTKFADFGCIAIRFILAYVKIITTAIGMFESKASKGFAGIGALLVIVGLSLLLKKDPGKDSDTSTKAAPKTPEVAASIQGREKSDSPSLDIAAMSFQEAPSTNINTGPATVTGTFTKVNVGVGTDLLPSIRYLVIPGEHIQGYGEISLRADKEPQFIQCNQDTGAFSIQYAPSTTKQDGSWDPIKGYIVGWVAHKEIERISEQAQRDLDQKANDFKEKLKDLELKIETVSALRIRLVKAKDPLTAEDITELTNIFSRDRSNNFSFTLTVGDSKTKGWSWIVNNYHQVPGEFNAESALQLFSQDVAARAQLRKDLLGAEIAAAKAESAVVKSGIYVYCKAVALTAGSTLDLGAISVAEHKATVTLSHNIISLPQPRGETVAITLNPSDSHPFAEVRCITAGGDSTNGFIANADIFGLPSDTMTGQAAWKPDYWKFYMPHSGYFHDIPSVTSNPVDFIDGGSISITEVATPPIIKMLSIKFTEDGCQTLTKNIGVMNAVNRTIRVSFGANYFAFIDLSYDCANGVPSDIAGTPILFAQSSSSGSGVQRRFIRLNANAHSAQPPIIYEIPNLAPDADGTLHITLDNTTRIPTSSVSATISGIPQQSGGALYFMHPLFGEFSLPVDAADVISTTQLPSGEYTMRYLLPSQYQLQDEAGKQLTDHAGHPIEFIELGTATLPASGILRFIVPSGIKFGLR